MYLLTCGSGMADKALNDLTMMSLKQYSHFLVLVVILAPQLGHFIDIISIALLCYDSTSTFDGIHCVLCFADGSGEGLGRTFVRKHVLKGLDDVFHL